MAQLFYMSLPGVGWRWDAVLKEVGAQFKPYNNYLLTAIKAAERRKQVLMWRAARTREKQGLQENRKVRKHENNQRRQRGKKRRQRMPTRTNQDGGFWLVLEPPPWRPEESDKTFDAFFAAKEVYDKELCYQKIRILDHDREGRALLLERAPIPYESDKGEDALPVDAQNPQGQLLWLRPNTYTLTRQQLALRNLENTPSPRLAPLIRLVSTRAEWETPVLETLLEGEWSFLRRNEKGELRDGTEKQRRFVDIAMTTPDFALLDGPPGSGKTTAICELIVQLLRRGKRVLLVASTHVAVDNVLERILEWQDECGEKLVLPVRIGEEGKVTSEEIKPWILSNLIRTWRGELLDFFEKPGAVDPAADGARTLLKLAIQKNQSKEEASPLIRLILESANLVCGTTIGILQHPAIKASRGGGTFEPFDVMILDEASKTTFTEFLVPALHARRWVIVGDIKQLSPYVEEADLAENLRGLLPAPQARAAVHAFLASRQEGRRARQRSILATSKEDADLAVAEARQREVEFVDLDHIRPRTLRGVPNAIPELLYADLVLGSPRALQRYEHRLPPDLPGIGGTMPELPTWLASREAWLSQQRKKNRYVDTNDIDWGDAVAWRLIRSYELRQNKMEKARYQQDIDGLLPRSLDEEWFHWRRMKPQRGERADEGLKRELQTIRRVAMPSILELLQTGFARLPGWNQSVALTDGLPTDVLAKRMVSLSYQHRMHPHISAFSREQFYTEGDKLTDRQRSYLRMYGSEYRFDQDYLLAPVVLGELEEARRVYRARAQLLQDANTMLAERAWGYSRYRHRALWLAVKPSRRRGDPRNSNRAEAEAIIEEVQVFQQWASDNPRQDNRGRPRSWTVAVLTFYRGQEAFLRGLLQRESQLWGHSRNFYLPHGKPREAQIHVTLCTVDRFQGHEADLLLLSFVKSGSGVGFLNSPNRLNVALTRARYQIVLVGDQAFFKQSRSDLLIRLATSKHYSVTYAWEKNR